MIFKAITKNRLAILIQLCTWLGIWSLTMFVESPIIGHNGLFHQIMSLRISLMAIFFNVVQRLLMPIFYRGKRQKFIFFSLLSIVLLVSCSVTIDLIMGFPQRMLEGMPQFNGFPPFPRKPLPFTMIPSLMMSILVYGVAATLSSFSAFEDKRKAEEEANRRRLEAELSLLKSQINPHFLLNTLNNIYTLSLTDSGKTPAALLKLSSMVQYILYDCNKPKVKLEQDLAFLEDYLALQKLRLPENVKLEIRFPDQEVVGQIEPMILINYIENAFKHGVSTFEDCLIRIQLSVLEQELHMHVCNSLWARESPVSQHGLGLSNTQQRLEHSYAGKYQLKACTENGLYCVDLKLKLNL
jgi:two-component system, LytTR family, sensor kinase